MNAFVIVARDRGIIDRGIIAPFAMSQEAFDATPEWSQSEFRQYGGTYPNEAAANAAIDTMPQSMTKADCRDWDRQQSAS